MGKQKETFKKIDRAVYRCMWAISIISGVCLVITALLCTGDALMSKFLSRSIPNGTEWVTYLNIPVVFFAIAYIQVDRGHTTVDLLYSKFPRGVRKAIKLIGDCLGTAACLFSGYCAGRLTLDKLHSMTKSSSAADAFVIWPFVLVIVIGFIAVGLAFAWCIVKDALNMNTDNPEGQNEEKEGEVEA